MKLDIGQKTNKQNSELQNLKVWKGWRDIFKMPNKNHKDKIREIREVYGNKNFRCKENFPVFNETENKFDLIDVVCFKDSEARAFEVENSTGGRQALKNAKDLKRFKSMFKNSKTCQLSPNDELKGCFRR